MENPVLLLVVCQALGALIGAGSAVWGELAYVKAMRDKKIDSAERAHLAWIGHGLRYGMSLLLVASFGLVVFSYMGHESSQPALSPSYWAFVAFALVVVTLSSLLARRQVSFKVGSAALLSGWWFLVYLSLGWLPLSFGAAAFAFLIVTAAFSALLHFTRFAFGANAD